MRSTLLLPVDDASQVGEVRRSVARLTALLGFDETGAGRAAIVATELATNLVKHARGGGRVLVQPVERDGALGIELLSLDGGPGMANVGRCLRDGFSTAGSPGTGLGAIGRAADTFEIHSAPGVGTALLARLWVPSAAARALTPSPVGGVAVPSPGEEVCGDAWAWLALPDGRTRLVMADGLGHGPEAHAASTAAVRLFLEHRQWSPAEALEGMHDALRGTRGAAVVVVELSPKAGELRYAGVGNVAAATVVPAAPDEGRNLASIPGIVGHEMRRVQEWTLPWPAGALLVVHTDGVNSRWSLDRYPGLASRDPALVSGVLFRDFVRGRDDATVAVVRHRGGAGGTAA